MAKKMAGPTSRPRERAFLVGVQVRNQVNLLSLEDSLVELALLADTAGLEVVGEAIQRLDHPHPDTFIGSGKVEEIKAIAEEVMAQVIIFDNELLPRHLRELEERFGDQVQVIDRTALILDIFAMHANTRDGSLQVELAQYEYRLPRLTRAWTHLARQSGGGAGRTGNVGGVGLRGPGETQLEVDRREIRKRITHLKQEIEKVRAQRVQHRAQRKRSQIPVVSLVGYTNAGKSTLLNRLAHSDIYVADQLFATLDPTTRRVDLPGGHFGLFTDTVGFIQKLPTQLLAAFRATLEEITEADLLIHVVDITHANVHAQARAVSQTLAEIGAGHIPVITALNKIDLLQGAEAERTVLIDFSNSVAISAEKGIGISDLLKLVEGQLFETYLPVSIRLPYQQGDLISLFHDQGQVSHIEHKSGGVLITGNLPMRLFARFQPYLKKETVVEEQREDE